jgi:hypothetical protein
MKIWSKFEKFLHAYLISIPQKSADDAKPIIILVDQNTSDYGDI